MPLKMKLTAITLDCSDPRALAAFYQEATGLDLHPGSGGDFAGLTRQDGLFIGFQRADGYQAPTWPSQNVPQQSHLDFAVDDLDEAEAQLLKLGAAKPDFQPGGSSKATTTRGRVAARGRSAGSRPLGSGPGASTAAK
jgi:catechol 2,3-dioxygenase-like lactoylglutathione lyase family enzyme